MRRRFEIDKLDDSGCEIDGDMSMNERRSDVETSIKVVHLTTTKIELSSVSTKVPTKRYRIDVKSTTYFRLGLEGGTPSYHSRIRP